MAVEAIILCVYRSACWLQRRIRSGCQCSGDGPLPCHNPKSCSINTTVIRRGGKHLSTIAQVLQIRFGELQS